MSTVLPPITADPFFATARGAPAPINQALLRELPLPRVPEPDEADGRGRVFVVGGCRQAPGAIILAGTAALRAGARRLHLGTAASIAPLIGVAVPEAIVHGLTQTESGAISPAAAEQIVDRGNWTSALLIGPGMLEEEAVGGLVERVLYRIARPVVVLDASALTYLTHGPKVLHRLDANVVLTMRTADLARALGAHLDRVVNDRLEAARRAASMLRAVVALRGTETLVVAPDGTAFRHVAGEGSLFGPGSSETFAGIVAGLAARGATPLEAAVWAAYAHGVAAQALAKRHGAVGTLARELLDELPGALRGV